MSDANQKMTKAVRTAAHLLTLAATLQSTVVFAVSNVDAKSQAGNSQTGALQFNWQEFQKNPKAFMEKVPQKYTKNANGKLVPVAPSALFNKGDISTQQFVTTKSKVRKGEANELSKPICNEKGICLKDVLEGRAAAPGSVTDFLDSREFKSHNVKPVATLKEMEERGLTQGELSETPWSDTYWPIYAGSLGARYADKNYAGRMGTEWRGYFDFVSASPRKLKSILDSKDPAQLDTLSPSGKYDLLIGGLTEQNQVYADGYLTPWMWNEGRAYNEAYGKVEAWMGLCHGWAPASFMVPRPRRSVTVKAADQQTDLKFYPSDLKGLSTYLWAKANTPQRFIGGRCEEKNPPTDPETGRILSEKCFDTNPGLWHVSMVNQVGVLKRSFVLDATYDYEVWNQPVYSYKYEYFNAQTGKPATTLAEAMVPLRTFDNDKFKKFRSRDARYIVGVQMIVAYIVETLPNHNEVDSPADDKVHYVPYMYDLELNDKMQIIGGEWYTNKHPDFIWMPLQDSRAISLGDQQLPKDGGWKPGQTLPAFWRDLAVTTAVRYGMPLANIIDPLIAESGRKKPLDSSSPRSPSDPLGPSAPGTAESPAPAPTPDTTPRLGDLY